MGNNEMSDNAGCRGKGTGIISISHAFVGRILGLFTHELNNHLATLRETIGLAEDVSGVKNISDKDKMKEMMQIIESLTIKLDKIIYLSRNLGSFGQQLEIPSQDCNIAAVIDELLVLIGREALQKNILLRKDIAAETLPAKADSFLVQMLLYCLIDNMVMQLEGGSVVTIRAGRTADSVSISLVSDTVPVSPAGKVRWSGDDLASVAGRIKAEYYEKETGSITVSIPLR